MKTFLLLVLVTLSFSSIAQTDFDKVRAEIELQAQSPDSELNRHITSLKTQGGLPHNSFLVLADSRLLQKGNEQKLHECTEEGCFYYERNFFRQISDLRWVNDSQTELKAWLIGIYVHVFRIWNSNPEGEVLDLKREEINIDTVTFLPIR